MISVLNMPATRVRAAGAVLVERIAGAGTGIGAEGNGAQGEGDQRDDGKQSVHRGFLSKRVVDRGELPASGRSIGEWRGGLPALNGAAQPDQQGADSQSWDDRHRARACTGGKLGLRPPEGGAFAKLGLGPVDKVEKHR